MSEDPKTYSILVRLRRVIHQDAYVSVPVSGAIVIENADGRVSIDPESLWAEAIRLSENAEVGWQSEEAQTEPHPLQGPVPEGRFVFDPTHI